MRTANALPGARADAAAAVVAVSALGLGAVVGLAGAAGGGTALALAGGALAATALTVLIAAGWIPALALLAIALPLPALYGDDALRVSPAAALTALVLFGWALGRVRAPGAGLGALPLRATLALFGAIVLAAAFAGARAAAAREVVNFALLLGLLPVAVDILSRDRRRVHTLALTIAAVAGAAGGLAALQALGALPARFPLAGTPFHRATLGFGWPNELGVFFAVALPLCWYAVQSTRTASVAGAAGWLLARAGLALAGLGLLASFSRGAWLAFLLSAGVLLLAGGGRLVLRIGFGALAAVAVVDLAAGGIVTGRLWSLGADPFVVQRAALMLVGLLMFRANPIVGVGPGGFHEHLEDYGPAVPWLWDYVGSAHNAYLEIAAEAGLIGLLALLWFLSANLVVLLRSARAADDERDAALRRALLWAFAAACLAGFTAWPFAHGIGQLVMLVIAMGLVAARAP